MEIITTLTTVGTLILLLILVYTNLKLSIKLLDILRESGIVIPKEKSHKETIQHKIVPLRSKTQQQYEADRIAKYYPDIAKDPDLFFKDKNNDNSLRNTN